MNATVDDIELADRIIIDIDPGGGVTWDAVVEAALHMRDVRKAEGRSSPATRAIHVMAPLPERMTHDAAHGYARQLASVLAARYPNRYVLSP